MPATDPVTERVLAIVAEQTGYPTDMLEMDLDLEADLGVDTVKQAETFVAIRKEFDIPRRDDLSLRDYNTLEKVVGFVLEMRPDLAVSSQPSAVSEQYSEASVQSEVVAADPLKTENLTLETDPVTEKVLAIVAEQTGYPTDMLEMDLDLEADLGVDTVKQAETFVAIRKEFDIPRRDDLSLRDYNTLEKVVGFVLEMRPELAVSSQPSAVSEQYSEASVQSEVVAADPLKTENLTLETDPVTEKVLAIVAEQTGYPTDMLEMDLDLEADLGVDTVKQAETFVAIRKEFDIPRRDDLSLRDYNTLEKVVGFVLEMRPELAVSSQPTAVSEQYSEASVQSEVVAADPLKTENLTLETDPVTEKVLAIVAEQTGYPTDMLELDLDLEADLGVDTVKQAETFLAIRKEFDIPRQDELQLRNYPTLQHVINFVKEMRPDLKA